MGLWATHRGKTEEVRRGHNTPDGPEGLQLQGGGMRSGEEG